MPTSSATNTSLIARCAAAIDPEVISSVKTSGEAHSLHDFLKPGPSYGGTPEVYCFGLLEHFDIEQLIQLAKSD